jgi:hypothetical protein
MVKEKKKERDRYYQKDILGRVTAVSVVPAAGVAGAAGVAWAAAESDGKGGSVNAVTWPPTVTE